MLSLENMSIMLSLQLKSNDRNCTIAYLYNHRCIYYSLFCACIAHLNGPSARQKNALHSPTSLDTHGQQRSSATQRELICAHACEYVCQGRVRCGIHTAKDRNVATANFDLSPKFNPVWQRAVRTHRFDTLF